MQNIKEISSKIANSNNNNNDFVYQQDKHFYFSSSKAPPSPLLKSDGLVTLIIYAQLGTKEFDSFHAKIVSLIKESPTLKLDYILRHNYEEEANLNHSGYGV